MSKYKCVIVISILILLAACNGNKPIKERIEDNISCQTVPASPPPNWVFGNPNNDISSYFGVGVSDGFNTSFNGMKKQSRVNAEIELSSSIEVRVTSSLRKSIESKLTSNEIGFKQTVSQVVKSNTDLLLSDVKINGTWFNRNTCQLWTRVGISKKSLKESKKQMKSMLMLKLEQASKNIESIKSTIENDPNVILRKYGMTINSTDYIRAFKLPIEDGELFSILDIYEKYGSTPNSFAHMLGAWSIEPFSTVFMSLGGVVDRPYFNNTPTLLHLVSMMQVEREVLDSVSRFFHFKKLRESASKVRYKKGFDAWVESARNEIDKKIDNIENIRKPKLDEITKRFHNHLSVEKYEGEIAEMDRKLYEIRIDMEKSKYSLKNDKFNDDFFAVHYAACYGGSKNLIILKNNGFSMTKKTGNGYSPIEVAKQCNNISSVDFLD